jgi:hypothetical protein
MIGGQIGRWCRVAHRGTAAVRERISQDRARRFSMRSRVAWRCLAWLVICATPTSTVVPQSSTQNSPVDIPGDRPSAAELSIGLERDLLAMNGVERPRAMAYALMRAGKLRQAEELLRSYLDANKNLTGSAGIRLAEAERDLGNLLRYQGQWAEAELLLKRALERSQRRSDRAFMLIASKDLVELLSLQGKYAEAEPLLRMVEAGAKTEFRLDRENSLNAELALAFVLLADKKSDELVGLLQSIEAKIDRYGFRGLEIDARVQRLKYLKFKNGPADEMELRREVAGAIGVWQLGAVPQPFPPRCFGPNLWISPQLC